MYRIQEEQMKMLTVCEEIVDNIFDEYDNKELDNIAFVSKCSFACGFLYATFGDGGKYECMEALIKLMIDNYQSVGGTDDEKE